MLNFYVKKKLISTFFDEIAQDTGRYCFGVDETLKALTYSAVEILIVWENLEIQRVTLRNTQTGTEKNCFY